MPAAKQSTQICGSNGRSLSLLLLLCGKSSLSLLLKKCSLPLGFNSLLLTKGSLSLLLNQSCLPLGLNPLLFSKSCLLLLLNKSCLSSLFSGCFLGSDSIRYKTDNPWLKNSHDPGHKATLVYSSA